MPNVKITFEPKSQWQKDDCIRRGCPNESTLEAVGPQGRVQARVRCCTDKKCKERAAELARHQSW